jgi:VCBS repeat-containing protein
VTIDDMPRTFDISAGRTISPAVTAVPDFTRDTRVINMGAAVPGTEAPEPIVRIGEPDRSTGVVCGSVTVVDQANGAAHFGPTQFTTTKGGLVTVGEHSGRFTYTPSVQAQQVARISPDTDAEVDTFTIYVADRYGHSNGIPVVVDILAGNAPPTGAANVGLPFETGVVVGRIEGAAWDGSKLTFSLVNSSNPADSTAESAYSEKGGLIQLETRTGRFVFIPQVSEAAIPGRDTDRFVVTAIDTHGGTADIAVVALAHLKIAVETTSTAPDRQCGRLLVSGSGPLSFSLGAAPTKGSVQVHENGTYAYLRTPDLGPGITADDSFTVLGTDSYGRSITVAKVAVSPPLTNTVPAACTVAVMASALDGDGVQTTTGMLTAAGAVRFVPGALNSAKGGVVTIGTDGTFSYSTAGNPGIGHAAAALNAPDMDKVDTFTATAQDQAGSGLPVVATVTLLSWNNTPAQGTVGASGRMRGLPTGDWTTTVVDLDGDDITWTVHQAHPRGFVMIARTALGKWAVHYESMSPKTGGRHPGETFTVRYRDGHVKRDGTPAFVEATYEF